MGPLLNGIILGLSLATVFGFGPALFALIQTSIHRGFWAGVLLAIGIFLSDVFFVGLCIYGAVQVITAPENTIVFGLVSGGVLLLFGYFTFTRKVELNAEATNDPTISSPNKFTYILKGFSMNIANPFIWIFWVGVVAEFTAVYEADWVSLVYFFAAALLTVFTTDILKCFAAFKIKRYVTSTVILWINRVAGISLALFGIYLILRVIFKF